MGEKDVRTGGTAFRKGRASFRMTRRNHSGLLVSEGDWYAFIPCRLGAPEKANWERDRTKKF